MVPHHSTDYAINCLTAQIGRDAVGLVVYGRSLKVRVCPRTYIECQASKKEKSCFFFFFLTGEELSPNTLPMSNATPRRFFFFFFFLTGEELSPNKHITHVECHPPPRFFFFFSKARALRFFTRLVHGTFLHRSGTILFTRLVHRIFLHGSGHLERFLSWWMALKQCPHKKKKKKKKRERRCCSFEQIYRTMGLISADRSNKATLLLTIPRSIKVVCNGFISSNIWN